MNFDEEIQQMVLEQHSKSQVYKIISWVGSSTEKMKALMNCVLSDNVKLCQRASWNLIYINQNSPELLEPHLIKLIDRLGDAKHEAIVRNTVRIFLDRDVPEEIEGKLLEKCFQYINDTKTAGAIRAYAIKVATKIIVKYPELAPELIMVLEEHYRDSSKAFQGSARFAFKKFGRVKR